MENENNSSSSIRRFEAFTLLFAWTPNANDGKPKSTPDPQWPVAVRSRLDSNGLFLRVPSFVDALLNPCDYTRVTKSRNLKGVFLRVQMHWIRAVQGPPHYPAQPFHFQKGKAKFGE
uniref:Uncharacterized protein n=1 Tax=Nelumbo nucifera TaxID=4432 RepID=A0A822ZMC7_NELNU|nr:TPA_asm: hypothetical protein HUJ06_002346 [Nelumbo nucifera]